MRRSRRLVFVLSPDFPAEKSLSLHEGRLGLYLQQIHQASIVAVIYCSVSKLHSVEVAQLRQSSTCRVTWRGGRSEPRHSRFWLRLQLALPVRPLALGRRLIDSTSSHSDLAALALHRAHRLQNRTGTTNQSHINEKASADQIRRGRRTLPRGRPRVRRVVGSQYSRRCSGCTGFTSQVEGGRAELRVETEVQQVPCDAESTQIPDSAYNTDYTSNHAPLAGPTHFNSQQEEAGSVIKQQQVTGASLSEETVGRKEGSTCGEDATCPVPVEDPN
ncbi:uncharacterized protein [Nothobranchius furzeri]|uniref:LOC107379883-like protein n=1 Tax=Nothobranchius furzeri TaxID=105023 RepID=A0A9D2YD81_NOTFU|nr:uncharacterized protein LOC107379883 [Nothobranchius furzeri]KAF7218361.1 putative LOC107379883-like protein [Nothobranchius furzeri]